MSTDSLSIGMDFYTSNSSIGACYDPRTRFAEAAPTAGSEAKNLDSPEGHVSVCEEELLLFT